jgi:hypothetical protein
MHLAVIYLDIMVTWPHIFVSELWLIALLFRHHMFDIYIACANAMDVLLDMIAFQRSMSYGEHHSIGLHSLPGCNDYLDSEILSQCYPPALWVTTSTS